MLELHVIRSFFALRVEKAVKGPRYLSRLHARACAPNLAFHLWGNACVWKRVWVERKALLLDHKVRAFLAALRTSNPGRLKSAGHMDTGQANTPDPNHTIL